MLSHVKTSLTMNQCQTLSDKHDNGLNIWEQSAKFAATKQNRLKTGLTTNSLSRFDRPPKEEHASCISEDNIPNYLDDHEN